MLHNKAGLVNLLQPLDQAFIKIVRLSSGAFDNQLLL